MRFTDTGTLFPCQSGSTLKIEMVMTKESGIIELETLVPLFIKGKEPDYGEGIYTIGDKAYILDNNKLCEFIYKSTYDDEGKYRAEGKDYVEWYAEFMKLNRRENEIVDSYNTFAQLAGLKPESVDDRRDIPEKFKKKSAQYFLDELGLLSSNKKANIELMSMGATTLRSSEGQKKFIQNGRGECFLPGSSIKGAMRNALLWKILGTEQSIRVTVQDYVTRNLSVAEQRDNRGQRKFAEKFSKYGNCFGNSLDAITFSRYDPKFKGEPTGYDEQYIDDYNARWKSASEIHRDLFRIVNITDAKFVGRAKWQIARIKTYKLSGASFQARDNTDAELEAVGKGTKARFRITIDKALATEFFSGNIPPYLQSIDALLQIVHEFFMAVATGELAFYNRANNPGCIKDVRQWYDELLNPSDDERKNSSLFRFGWGGGMMSKTQCLHLKEQDRKRVRNLTNDRGEEIAPQSRCLQVDEDHAIQPLGWCWLRNLGKNDSEAEAAHQKSTPTPAGCVRATIIDDQCKPVQVRIDEGEYQNTEASMPGVTLDSLGLKKGSVVFVVLVTQRGKKGKRQLIKAAYKSKP